MTTDTSPVNLSLPRTARALLLGTLLLAGCSAKERFDPVGPDLEPPSTASTIPALVPYAGDGFSVSLPGKGEVEKQTTQSAAGPIEITFVTATQAAGSYGVSYFSIPATGNDLDAAARGAAAGVKGTLTDLQKVGYKGYEGRDYRVTRSEGPSTVFARVLTVKKRSFLVQAVLDGDHSTPPDLYRQVLESLTFS